MGEAAEPVVTVALVEPVLEVVDDVWPDVSAETASTNWAAAEAVACRIALTRLCCWLPEEIALIDMIRPRVAH
ncbi:hypothetical protein ACRAWG_19260 [Methylobacterium sp. P31]